MKPGVTEYAHSVDQVFIFIVAVSVLILIGVTAAMIYFVIRYSRKRNPVASQIEGNLLLEITWIAIPTLLVLLMFYFGYTTFTSARSIPEGAMIVKVTGQMWKWGFEYENGKRYDTLYLPVNKPVKLELNSLDVVHSFFIPAYRLKEDVTPNEDNYLAFIPDKIGTFEIACAEYCGMRHSYMYNALHVIPEDEFKRWVAVKQTESDSTSTGQNKANTDSSKTADQSNLKNDSSNNKTRQPGK